MLVSWDIKSLEAGPLLPDRVAATGLVRVHDREKALMGKGDQRTRRGKIYRGSFGKARLKDPTKEKRKAAKGAKR